MIKREDKEGLRGGRRRKCFKCILIRSGLCRRFASSGGLLYGTKNGSEMENRREENRIDGGR